jgi:hypothetical protein
MSDFGSEKALLDLPEDEILALIGADLAGPQALPLRPAEQVERARRWLTAQRDYLEEQICSNDGIKQFVFQTTDNVAIATELGNLLAGLLLPVNPVPLAVLLAKRGLKTFCSARWSGHV